MANNRESSLSLGDRLKKTVAIGTLSMIGMTGIAACSTNASAEKVPTTTSISATKTPGETPSHTTTTTTETTPSTAETAPGEFIGGIDVTELGPVARARAEALTPDKIEAMSPDERAKLFTITSADLGTDENKIYENYGQLSYVLIAAALHSGCTFADTQKIGTSGYPGVPQYVAGEYLQPEIDTAFGEAGTVSPIMQITTFGVRNYLLTGTDRDPAVSSKQIGDYKVDFSHKSFEVTKPSAALGEQFSIKIVIGYSEPLDYSPKMAMAGLDPKEGKPISGTMTAVLQGIKANASGIVQPDYMGFESVQN